MMIRCQPDTSLTASHPVTPNAKVIEARYPGAVAVTRQHCTARDRFGFRNGYLGRLVAHGPADPQPRRRTNGKRTTTLYARLLATDVSTEGDTIPE